MLLRNPLQHLIEHKYAILLAICIAILLGVGITILTSTSMWINNGVNPYHHLTRQTVWLVIGIIAAWVFAILDYNLLKKYVWVLYIAYGVSLGLLILLYIPGVGVNIKGETRWLEIPGVVRFQPSEFAKITTLSLLALWYALHQENAKKLWKGFIVPSLILGVPTLLIFFEKDMGTACSLAAAGLVVIFIAGANLIYLLPSLGAATYAFYLLVTSNPNRMARMVAFMDLEKYKMAEGMQQWQSLLAIANGGIDGVGLGKGAGKHGYIPLAENDFIFPIIAEELGWVALLVILCFLGYSLFGMLIATHADSPFGHYLAYGLTAIVAIPAAMNLGVTTSVLPNTGLPLPLISYGGSNLMITLASIGILFSIHRQSVKRKRLQNYNDPLTQQPKIIRI